MSRANSLSIGGIMYQDDNQGGGRPRPQMHDVASLNITCATCDAAIEQLPFQPTEKEDGTYGKLYCYDCNKKRRQDRGPRF